MAQQEKAQPQRLPEPEAPKPLIVSDRPLAEAREVWFLPHSVRGLTVGKQDTLTSDEAWFSWSTDGQSLLARSKLNGSEVEYPRNATVVYYEAQKDWTKQRDALLKAYSDYESKLLAWRESDGFSYVRKVAEPEK
jgi:hypothetical protein